MRKANLCRDVFVLVLCWFFSASAALADTVPGSGVRVEDTGISGLWVLANISYAGMRAQNSPSKGWRILAFIFGLPGTIVTFLAVKEGTDRAYGIDLPRRSRP